MSTPMAGRTASHGLREAFVKKPSLRKFSFGLPASSPSRSMPGHFGAEKGAARRQVDHAFEVLGAREGLVGRVHADSPILAPYAGTASARQITSTLAFTATRGMTFTAQPAS